MRESKQFFAKQSNSLNKGAKDFKENYVKGQGGIMNNLPDPDVISAYESVSPGFMDKVLAIAQSEQQHTHNLSVASGVFNRKMFYINRSIVVLGICAFVSIIALLVAAHPELAFALCCVALFAVYRICMARIKQSTSEYKQPLSHNNSSHHNNNNNQQQNRNKSEQGTRLNQSRKR